MKRVGKEPPVDVFDEFFWLFGERRCDKLTEGQKAKMRCVGNYDASMELYLATKRQFNGYEEFLEYMKKNSD